MASVVLYLRLIRAQVRSQLSYPLAFALDVAATVLLTLTEFAAFALVMQRFPRLGGWTLGEVALLYGLAELGFALMDLVFGGFDAPNLDTLIRQGRLDTLLLRPAPLTMQVFGSEFALRRVGRMVLAGGILLLALHLHPVMWSPLKLLLLLLSVLGLVLFFGGLFIVGGTLTFWTQGSLEAMNILTYGGKALISYPLTIYDEWLRRAALLVPVGLLSYPPALRLLDRPFPAGLPGWTAWLSPVIGVAMLLLGLRFWRFGLRRYQGAGA
ncbi:ABC transporter permease [Deinococcus sonorensis]|uniref:ABC-2 family transporter protein n=2 Tax=Deinococcus sonorensis TaxID=309891 RepID=A0AAU7UDB6_9DEIO